MKKIFSRNKIKEVIGRPVNGFERARLGLSYESVGGEFYPENPASMDMLFAALKAYPELHVISYMNEGPILNRYEEEDVLCYKLCHGDKDENIELVYTEQTEEEAKELEKFLEGFKNREPDIVETAVLNWAMWGPKVKE